MGYTGKVISGDCHVDIPWLPADLFTSNAPSHLKDRMPHVEDTKDGEQWFAGGRQLGCVGGAGIGLQPSLFWDPYVPGVSTRLDRMEEKNFFTDAKEGLFHPTTPELRIKDQDTDGIKGEVLYGVLALASGFGSTQGEEGEVIGGDEPSGPGYGLTDPDAILSAFDIYNQYIADFCNTNPDRLAALACLFARDPQEAARQVHRAAELGLKGTELNVSSTEEPIYLRDWDPLWAAVDESGLPISFHTVGLSPKAPKRDTTAAERAIMTGVALTVFQLSGCGICLQHHPLRRMRAVPKPEVRVGRMRRRVATLRPVQDGRRGRALEDRRARPKNEAVRILAPPRIFHFPDRVPHQ